MEANAYVASVKYQACSCRCLIFPMSLFSIKPTDTCSQLITALQLLPRTVVGNDFDIWETHDTMAIITSDEHPLKLKIVNMGSLIFFLMCVMMCWKLSWVCCFLFYFVCPAPWLVTQQPISRNARINPISSLDE